MNENTITIKFRTNISVKVVRNYNVNSMCEKDKEETASLVLTAQ